MQCVLTNKTTVDQIKLLEYPSRKLDKAEIRLKIEHFGFTSNNITYAVIGDRFGYWNFFPAPKDADKFGIIPVWGYGKVIESDHTAINLGQKYFGYFPLATELIVKPGQITDRSFIDESPHRSMLPTPYNTYHSASDSIHVHREYDRMTLSPLYLTSFIIWHAVKKSDWYGAEQILLLSASSKTSIGTAYAFRMDESAPLVVGMTSSTNIGQLKELDIYNQLVTYQDWTGIDLKKKTLVIDMSGNLQIRSRLFNELGVNFQYCLKVGLSHWDATAGDDIPKEKGTVFFAPSFIGEWIEQKGMADFYSKSNAFFKGCSQFTSSWFEYKLINGLDELVTLFPLLIKGAIPANNLNIIRL